MLSIAFPATSTREDYEIELEVEDADNGQTITFEPTDIIAFSIRNEHHCLNASTVTGEITILDDTVIVISLPKERIATFCAGQYQIGATMVRDSDTTQLFVGTIQIYDGIVPPQP